LAFAPSPDDFTVVEAPPPEDLLRAEDVFAGTLVDARVCWLWTWPPFPDAGLGCDVGVALREPPR